MCIQFLDYSLHIYNSCQFVGSLLNAFGTDQQLFWWFRSPLLDRYLPTPDRSWTVFGQHSELGLGCPTPDMHPVQIRWLWRKSEPFPKQDGMWSGLQIPMRIQNWHEPILLPHPSSRVCSNKCLVWIHSLFRHPLSVLIFLQWPNSEEEDEVELLCGSLIDNRNVMDVTFSWTFLRKSFK